MDASDRDANRFAARWFKVWLWFFGAAIAASLATVTLGFVPQMKMLGVVTLGLATAGLFTCLLGLRLFDRSGWHAVRDQLSSVRESARSATEALAQPRVEPRIGVIS